MKFTITPSHPTVLAHEDATIHVRVRCSGGKLPKSFNRPDVDTVLVLDGSGSMGGTPWQAAVNAAVSVLEKLGGTDRSAVIVYSNAVQTIAPLGHDHKQAISRLKSLRMPSGGTNLAGGLQEALEILSPDSSRQQRVFLLSDGLANVGQTVDAKVMAQWAKDSAEHGVKTATFGLGAHYNEDLLQAIADGGQAGYYYLADEQVTTGAFAKELEELMMISAKDATVRIQAADGSRITQVLGLDSYVNPKKADEWIVQVGDVPAQQIREAIVVLETTGESLAGSQHPATAVGLDTALHAPRKQQTAAPVQQVDQQLVTAVCRYVDPFTNKARTRRADAVSQVVGKETAMGEVNEEVMALFAELEMSVAQKKAADAMRHGQYSQADSMLKHAYQIGEHQHSRGTTDRLRDKLSRVQEQLLEVTNLRAAPAPSAVMASSISKSMSHDSYQSLTSRTMVPQPDAVAEDEETPLVLPDLAPQPNSNGAYTGCFGTPPNSDFRGSPNYHGSPQDYRSPNNIPAPPLDNVRVGDSPYPNPNIGDVPYPNPYIGDTPFNNNGVWQTPDGTWRQEPLTVAQQQQQQQEMEQSIKATLQAAMKEVDKDSSDK